MLYFYLFWIQQLWSKPVIICVSIRKYIFVKHLKMSEKCAGRKLRNKNPVKQS